MKTDSGLTGLTFTRPSLVKVQFADECDISLIVKRFVRTGELPNLAIKTPLKIADTSMLPEDFQALQEQHVAALRLFESEPLELQELFHHDAAAYFDWRAMSDADKVSYIKSMASPDVCSKLIKGYEAPVPDRDHDHAPAPAPVAQPVSAASPQ